MKLNIFKSISKPFTFRFKDCSSLINRNTICSSVYIAILVLTLSYFYHFNYIEIYSTYQIIESFLQKFISEFVVSILFLIILSWNMYILSKSILDKKNYDIKFKHIFNIYSHVYTILFLLDISFMLIFKDMEINQKIQSIYILSSVIISIIVNILYPLLFLRYLSKNNIDLIQPVKRKFNFMTTINSNKILNFIKKCIGYISKILLLKNDFYLNELGSKSFYKHCILFIPVSIVFVLLKLELNPNIINFNYSLNLMAYSTTEILKSYILNTSIFILAIILLSLTYWVYIKFKHFKHNKFMYTLKIIINSLYVIILLDLGNSFQKKIISSEIISTSILPTQSIAVIISLLTYICIIYISFFFIKNILLKSYKIQKITNS